MEYGVSVGTVAYWVEHARGQRLDRVSFDDRKPGRAWNRIRMDVEAHILSVRRTLREDSVLGEYGPDAIGLALQEDSLLEQLPSRTTIYRVLERHGALDGTHRQRRPAPPKGWHLPALAKGQAELDSFDFIEDLKIAGGPLVLVLTATSLHGALAVLGPESEHFRACHPPKALCFGAFWRLGRAVSVVLATTGRWASPLFTIYAEQEHPDELHGERPGDRTPREKPQEGQEEQNADEPAPQAVQIF